MIASASTPSLSSPRPRSTSSVLSSCTISSPSTLRSRGADEPAHDDVHVQTISSTHYVLSSN